MTAALTCEPPPIVRKSGQEPLYNLLITGYKVMLPVAFHARVFAVSLNRWGRWGRWRQRRRQRRGRRRLGAGRRAELAAVITCQPPVLALHFRPRCLVLGGDVLLRFAKVGAGPITRLPGAIRARLGGAVAFFGRKRLRARHEARQEQGDTLSRRRPSRGGSRSSSGDAPARAEAKRLRLATVERPQVG